MTAPTGQAKEILNLAPAAPPRPLLDILADETSGKATTFNFRIIFKMIWELEFYGWLGTWEGMLQCYNVKDIIPDITIVVEGH